MVHIENKILKIKYIFKIQTTFVMVMFRCKDRVNQFCIHQIYCSSKRPNAANLLIVTMRLEVGRFDW
jgi:hypothetical protein